MGDEYRVRKFSEEDAFAVSELIARTLVESNLKDYSQQCIDGLIESYSPQGIINKASSLHFYVVCSNDGIIGCGGIGSYFGKKDESCLFSIFVLPSYQGKGIGKMIVKTLENDELFLTAKRIEVPSSITACEFYKALGYIHKDGKVELDKNGLYHLEKYR
ncbi:MAG: GNAT family N-acetyltransferase [Clostridia bacterium]|nr:GNAT family N-acetyltransferase [Clostridia bacterium]